MSSDVRIGVDIGGTFTDVVCSTPEGTLRYAKFPTTRGNESEGVLESITYMAQAWGVEPTAITQFAHGTTVATNTVLERKGACVGLITTKGFRDQLEIGRQMRHQMYEASLDPETPSFLIPGSRRKEVSERLAADGSVLVELDEEQVVSAARDLVEDGAEAIVICFLFSFRNPSHELRARDLILERHPELVLSLSHEVDPSFREYERLVVTAFDAYVKPAISRYLGRLEQHLQRAGVRAPLQVMQSRGGLMASAVARQRPVRLFLSGPAAGVIGGQLAGQSAGLEDLITVDVGGTSSDIALIARGRATVRAEAMIDGYPVRVPMVDVNSIGAGGGSIARVDRGGTLRIGPQSAGSEPGPACYGRGGANPTVTDASVVLGYIDPDSFAGGSLRLDAELAHRAIYDQVARLMDTTVQEAALGVHRLVNAQMSEGIRLMSIRQGLDPRRFAILPMGGGGGLHALPLAGSLGISRVIVPRFPGVLSAIGLLAAPTEHEVFRYLGLGVAETTRQVLLDAMRELDGKCADLMSSEELNGRPVAVRHSADVCFMGQSHTLEVFFDASLPDVVERLYDDFLEVHSRVRGHSARVAAQIVNLRTVHRSQAHPFSSPTHDPATESHDQSCRRVVFAGSPSGLDATVYSRSGLPVGFSFAGPAIVEQPDTTILIEPGWDVTVDPERNIIASRPVQ